MHVWMNLRCCMPENAIRACIAARNPPWFLGQSDAVAAEGRYFRFLFSLAPMQQNVSQATCRMVEHSTGVNKLLGCQGAFGPCPTGDSMPDSFHTPCVWAKPWGKKKLLAWAEVRCDLFFLVLVKPWAWRDAIQRAAAYLYPYLRQLESPQNRRRHSILIVMRQLVLCSEDSK